MKYIPILEKLLSSTWTDVESCSSTCILKYWQGKLQSFLIIFFRLNIASIHFWHFFRYNFERLSNGLRAVQKFDKFHESIQEAYYPKLDEASEVKVWSPRQPFAKLQVRNEEFAIYTEKNEYLVVIFIIFKISTYTN